LEQEKKTMLSNTRGGEWWVNQFRISSTSKPFVLASNEKGSIKIRKKKKKRMIAK
jgi:hypothetical protein